MAKHNTRVQRDVRTAPPGSERSGFGAEARRPRGERFGMPPVALLVLLPRAAGARVVAAHLRSAAADGLDGEVAARGRVVRALVLEALLPLGLLLRELRRGLA